MLLTGHFESCAHRQTTAPDQIRLANSPKKACSNVGSITKLSSDFLNVFASGQVCRNVGHRLLRRRAASTEMSKHDSSSRFLACYLSSIVCVAKGSDCVEVVGGTFIGIQTLRALECFPFQIGAQVCWSSANATTTICWWSHKISIWVRSGLSIAGWTAVVPTRERIWSNVNLMANKPVFTNHHSTWKNRRCINWLQLTRKIWIWSCVCGIRAKRSLPSLDGRWARLASKHTATRFRRHSNSFN